MNEYIPDADDMQQAMQEQEQMIADALMRCEAAGADPNAIATLATACGIGALWNGTPLRHDHKQGKLPL